jgi:predicted ATPase
LIEINSLDRTIITRNDAILELESNNSHERMTNASLRAQVEGLEEDNKYLKSDIEKRTRQMGEKDDDIFKWKKMY